MQYIFRKNKMRISGYLVSLTHSLEKKASFHMIFVILFVLLKLGGKSTRV